MKLIVWPDPSTLVVPGEFQRGKGFETGMNKSKHVVGFDRPESSGVRAPDNPGTAHSVPVHVSEPITRSSPKPLSVHKPAAQPRLHANLHARASFIGT